MRIKKFCTYLGISLSIIGVPLGMYCNFLYPFTEWSPIFMFASVVLIISYRNLLLGKLPSYNKTFTLIIILQVLMLIYGVFSNELTSQFLSFHLYVLALIIALSSNDNNSNYNSVILITFIISCICTCFGAFFMWKGLISGEEAWELKQDNENYALEAFTAANGAIINFVCILCLNLRNKLLKVLLLLFSILDIYVIFMSTKRTPIFVLLLIIALYLYKTGIIDKKIFIKSFKIFSLLIILLLIAYINIGELQKLLDKFSLDFYNGVLNILGDTDVKDSTGSAISRYKSREWAFNYISNEFVFFNYIVGGGYMIRWIDNPLLQSYLDMGITGFILYLYIVVIYPIKSFFKLKNTISLFAVLLCIYNVVSTYSSGHPYAYIKYVPIVFLAFIMNLKNNGLIKNINYSKIKVE
ncbi:hypothetical protein [Flavobacterium hibisci]|uniref:hypothetical protein n=1 Tax=Flavobacterium hibisci TaxID=1914462 RepID=UPI001CBC8E2F|nr:hypothetical protein [Flavobacterium hibisci]MBZ4043049.1 hypothetical protein [Flavobacterium hibisci]